MIPNSLNIKGLQKRKSREAQILQSQSINSKKPQRVREILLKYKYRQRLLKIILLLSFITLPNSLYSQVGSSCATPVNLGLGSTYNGSQSFLMPSGEIWLKYINPSSSIRLNFIPDTTGGVNSLKFSEIYVYRDSCGNNKQIFAEFDTSQATSINYLLTKIPVYSNIYIYLKRYVNAYCGDCDTAYKNFTINIESNNNLTGGTSCNASPCPNNLVLNGDFEEYTSLTTYGSDWNNNICGWSSVWGSPEYYNSDNTGGLLDIPSIYTGSAGISTNCHIDVPPNSTSNIWYNGNSNNAMAGLNMDYGQYDVLEGNLSANLIASRQYFVSFNAINSGAENYAGEFMINFSGAAYSPNNGTDFTDYSDISLTCTGTPPSSIGQWDTYSNVFTATGGENRFHIGNIDNQLNTPSLNQGLITIGTLPEYLFVDNFVLVPLAYAGNDVSLCPSATAQLGTCPIPGASYTWSPTTGLDDPNIANPIATGTGTAINYTVYVTITIGGVTYNDNDVVTVTAGGTAVTLGASPLVLTSAGTTVITATPAGAGTYAFYDLANPGTILQNSTSNTYTTPTLSASTSYGVTLTDANGCTAQGTVNIIYTATPCNGSSPLTHISSNSTTQLTAGPYNGVAFDVSNGFTFNSDVSFTNCEFWIRDGATVNINSNKTVTMMTSLVRQCDKMWNRINNSGTLKALETTFTQGDMAVVMNDNSSAILIDCFFNDNVYGINTLTTTPQKTIYLDVTGTTFQHLNGFVTAYSGQPTHYTLPAAGILLTNCSNTDIGNDVFNANLFNNMYVGIVANTTNTHITNSFFNNFSILNPTSATPPAPGSGLSFPYSSSGVAILGLQSQNSGTAYTIDVHPGVGQVLGTNPTIVDADYKGILTTGIGAEINELIIEDCNVGIQNEAVTLLNHVEIFNCDINTLFNGINWLGNLTGSNLWAEGNTVNVSNTSFFNGNGIQISNNGAQTPNSGIFSFPQLINNEITLNNIGKGIRINNSSQTIASANTIHKNFTGTPFLGFDISASDSLTINNNELTCSTAYTTSGNAASTNVGIRVSASNDLTIACNSTNGHYYGITFLGDCDGTGANFRTNQIGTHYYGLFYQASALVGECLYNGNRWVTTAPSPNAFHARNDNAVALTPSCLVNSNAQYLLNEIRTSGTGDVTTNSFPVPANNRQLANPCTTGTFVLDNTGWITNNSGTDLVCNDPIGSNLLIINNLEMRAMGLAGALEFNDETKQNAEEHLYRTLKSNPDLLIESEALASFNDSRTGSTVEKQWIVNQRIKEAHTNSYLTVLKQNSNQINTIQQTLHSLLKSNADSVSINNTKVQLAYFQSLQETYESNWKNNLISKKLLATLTNNSIEPNNLIDYNYKLITGIYLSKILGQEVIDLHDDSTTIFNVAKQCPLAGGNAVYWARAMFETLVPYMNYNDDSACVQIVEERRSNEISSKALLDLNQQNNLLQVYPNPTNGLITVNSGENQNIILIELFDLIGNRLKIDNYSRNIVELDYTNISKGSYTLKITNQNNRINYFKIVIQ